VNERLIGTPFRVNVDATDNGHYVSAYGAGLVSGASGQKLQFSVTRGLLHQHFIFILTVLLGFFSAVCRKFLK